MKTIKAIVFMAVSVILGCNQPTDNGPSAAEVKTANAAISNGTQSATRITAATYQETEPGIGPYTFTQTISQPAGGKLDVAYSSDNNPYLGGFTLTATFGFTNWHDSATGYTINGTATAVLESNRALNDTKTHPLIQTQTMTGTLSLSGGPISSLTANYSIHSVDDPLNLESSGVFFQRNHHRGWPLVRRELAHPLVALQL
jgi:hypothetical protein